MSDTKGIVFLDLDGPILECRDRHYACYLELCRRFGVRARKRESYWQLRRRRTSAAELVRDAGASVEENAIRSAWIDLIEEPRFLRLDFVHPLVIETLAAWKMYGLRLLVVTLRRNEAAARAQLRRLRVLELLDAAIVCDPHLGGAGKAAAAKAWAGEYGASRRVWIGDTEADATAGTILGAELYLVSCGIRSAAYLRSLAAGRVVRDLPSLRRRIASSPRIVGIPRHR